MMQPASTLCRNTGVRRWGMRKSQNECVWEIDLYFEIRSPHSMARDLFFRAFEQVDEPIVAALPAAQAELVCGCVEFIAEKFWVRTKGVFPHLALGLACWPHPARPGWSVIGLEASRGS